MRKTCSSWRRPRIKMRSRQSFLTVRTHRSVWAFAFGPWLGVARAIVVRDVDAQDVLELAAAEDQDAVEAVVPDGAYPSLGVGVRVRGLDRRSSCDRSA